MLGFGRWDLGFRFRPESGTMNFMTLRPVFLRFARLLLGLVFLAAGLTKVADPPAFARALLGYRLLPEIWIPAVAAVLPWWEIVAGGFAVAGRWRLGALTVLALLSGGFLLVNGITLARGLAPDCACFGAGSGVLGPSRILLDAALLLLAIVLLYREPAGSDRDGDLER